LRLSLQRYPVTLYATNECAPCDNGRRLLQARGIPYTERRIVSEEDALALERAVGGRTVPALTIGAQPLRGFSDTDWTAYLDAAGYPRESKLPRNWQTPAPTPMVERLAPAPRAQPAPAPAVVAEPQAAEASAPAGVRF
jgi:glutaredoxin